MKTARSVCRRSKRCVSSLREICRPRIEALAQKFGERVQVIPEIGAELRQATFKFDSNLAHIDLRFRASTDQEVRKLVLDYELQILPILMKFVPHVQAEFPLEAIDPGAVAQWLDDRIVDFVRTYLSLHQNEYYLKDHMVVDPVANIRFSQIRGCVGPRMAGEEVLFHRRRRRAANSRRRTGSADHWHGEIT